MDFQPLVSIVTPCYNGEKYLDDFFSSILEQDYANIQLIVVDDGSIDQSSITCNLWSKKFSDNSIDFFYIKKKNGGAASALNTGFKYVKGDYLIYPDCDDVLLPSSISARVKFLEKNNTYGLVRGLASVVYEEYPNNVVSILGDNRTNKNECLFDDIVLGRTFVTCGCYLVRMSAFDKVFPERTILQSHVGQNWQILLPLTKEHKCGFVDLVVYKYFIRNSSHSHTLGTHRDQFSAEINREKKRELFLKFVLHKLKRKDLEAKVTKKYLYKYAYLNLYFGEVNDCYKFIVQNTSFVLLNPKLLLFFVLRFVYLFDFVKIVYGKIRVKRKSL